MHPTNKEGSFLHFPTLGREREREEGKSTRRQKDWISETEREGKYIRESKREWELKRK